MKRALWLALLAALALALAACSSDDGPAADSALDTVVAELGARDSARENAGDGARDGAIGEATAGDAGSEAAADGAMAPLSGLGSLSGDCDVLDNGEWNAATPFTFRNALDFGSAGFDVTQDKTKLSGDGQKILAAGNLNQGSLLSEVFAFEVLYRCELAKLLETEKTVGYSDPNGKKTDLVVEIDGRRIGVSVTRAVHFPHGQPLTDAEATKLLTDKLGDIPLAEANALPASAWTRSMLSIIAFDAQHADAIATAYGKLDAATKAKTIVIVTVTDGSDLHLY
ncbi:MAG: hypothetical protein KC503_32700 [Myxococcales bacterium]|nr:hypothetical protein [Myxococcales bacterium]